MVVEEVVAEESPCPSQLSHSPTHM